MDTLIEALSRCPGEIEYFSCSLQVVASLQQTVEEVNKMKR